MAEIIKMRENLRVDLGSVIPMANKFVRMSELEELYYRMKKSPAITAKEPDRSEPIAITGNRVGYR